MDCLDGDGDHDGDGGGDDEGGGDDGDGDDDNDDLTPPSPKVSVLQCMFAGSDSKEQSRSITMLPLVAVSDCKESDGDDYDDDKFGGGDDDDKNFI